MCIKVKTMTFTEAYSKKMEWLKAELKTADAILIGVGAGMSAAAGLTYSGERFMRYFSDFHRKYGISDMYTGGFYPYETLEEYWAWWSRHIFFNRYEVEAGKPYKELFQLVQKQNYFVLTTNVDHQFQMAGFEKKRLFYTQGDYGLWQCSKPCHNHTYDNEAQVRQMVFEQKNMKIPTKQIPRCPICQAPMTMNLRCDDSFVEDEGWHTAAEHYQQFLHYNRTGHMLFLELGVGSNTPGIIKYPFWQMTQNNQKAVYACINNGEAVCPSEIKEQSILINQDCSMVIADLLKTVAPIQN